MRKQQTANSKQQTANRKPQTANRKPQTKLAISIILSALSFNIYAAPCDSNFSSQGNFITGTTYKTYADLPNTNPANAYEGALADIAKEPSWKIIAQDKQKGLIQAVQAAQYDKGKVIPLNINIMPAGAGAKMTMDYVTPTGSLSPASAVKSQFCQTIEAATIAKNASSQASINSTVVPAEAIKNEQIFKAAEAKTETGTNAEYAKNGMPCVAEICLGDGIAELKKVKWDKAQKQAVNKYLLEYVNKNFRGNLKSSMPYLRKGFDGNTGVFDNQALTNLSEVTADCATQSYTLLSGYFTSRGGNLTNVIIRLLPAQDNTTQKWTVITIDRTYKTQSEKQNAEVVAQLKDRYSTFPSITSPVKEGAGQVYVNANQLMMTTFLPTATERARLHPACGGAEKVNIN